MAASIASAASSSGATMISVITMPIAGLPARVRAWTNSAAIFDELVSVSSIIQGLLQTRPSRASILSADSGPQVPDS